jgi:non-specific serine/threonine protein kinase
VESLREAIFGHLANRQALITLDTCEHLIGGAAEFVTEILARAPGCRVVATSRELLGVGGEVAYGLPSMQLPRGNGDAELAELARYDAVRLFLERAAAARPDFRLSARTASSVAEICRRLDGMPLALELAAARLRTFTPSQIADHLDQRFRLLTGGSRTAVPRQQTLAAAIDWSYRLLDDAERTLFERLSVFQGGFTLEAVTQVCTDDELDAFQMLELLPSLVDKSLVVVDAQGREARYRLLETLRQFARDRLDESGSGDEFRLRHARFFRDVAVEAGHNIRGPDEVRWWERIDIELDNLRQAMTWAMDAGKGELALGTAGSFWRFWWFKSRWSEGIAWVERALEAAGPEAAKPVRAEGLLAFGSLLEHNERHPEAEQALLEAIALYEELDAEGVDRDILVNSYAAAHINLSVELESLGRDPEEIAELNRRALEVSRRIDDPGGAAIALVNLAEAAARAGDLEEARRYYGEALEVSKAISSVQLLATHSWAVGVFELGYGSARSAQASFEQGRAHAEAGGMVDLVALMGAYLAGCDGQRGDPAAVERFATNLGEAFEENPEWRTAPTLRWQLLILRAGLDVAAEDFEHAATVLGAAAMLRGEELMDMRAVRDAISGALRANLDQSAVEAAVAVGRQLDGEAVNELLVA